MTIRVLVADDQSMVRAGFRMLLAGEEDIEVVAEAGNGREAVEKASRYHPAVILMDIRMPELDGLQATRRILESDNDARILILTHVRPRRIRLRGPESGRQRVRPEGRLTRAVDRGHSNRCRRRGASLADDHEARDPEVRPPSPSGPSEGTRRSQ
jgi:chemotaxis response regulator CheB